MNLFEDLFSGSKEDITKRVRDMLSKTAAPKPEKPKVTVEELISRGVSYVRSNGKVYRIEVTDTVEV